MTRMSTPVSVVLGSTTSGVNFALQTGAELRGSIRDDQGALNGARVVLYGADGRVVWWQSLTGSLFAVWGLPAGRYFLVAERPSTHAGAAYPSRDCGLSACLFTLSDPIDVAAGQVRSGLEIRLRRLTGTSSISGRIMRDDTAAGLEGVATVCSTTCVSVQSNSAGQFTVLGPGGRHVLRPGGLVCRQLCDRVVRRRARGAREHESRIPIVVRNAEAVTGLEIRLAAGSELRGRVTVPGILPSLSLRVFLYSDQGVLIDEAFPLQSAQGAFSFSRLPAGTYLPARVRDRRLRGWRGVWGTPCLSDPCILSGTPVTVAAGEVREGIDFTLEIGGWIVGKARSRDSISELQTIAIDLYDQSGAHVFSKSVGRAFSIAGVPAGTYYLKASAFGRSVIYDDVPCQPVCTPTAGTPVVVQAGRATTGIEIVVDNGTSMSGSVRDAETNLPLSGVTVLLTDPSGAFVGRTETDLAGVFEFGDVGPGRYFARTANRVGYVDEVFDDRLCSLCSGVTATPIDVGLTPDRESTSGWCAAGGSPVA